MIPLPIHYIKVHVGFVYLDTKSHQDLHHLPWRLELPPNVPGKGHTKDVLIGLLREDETILNRSTIYLMLSGRFKARLDKVVLHPDLHPLLNQHQQLQASPRKESIFHDLRSRLMAIPRVIHIDHNQMNCQTTNLRELSYEPLEEPSGLYNEE